MSKLEVIVLNKDDAISAEKAGADRLELVADMSVGGISPCLEIVKEVTSSVNIPVNVMVRCRGGNFVYTSSEMDKHIEYINNLQNLPVNGVVFGSLTSENIVDIEQLNQVIGSAQNLDLTFHRAIDEDVNNYIKNIKILNGKVTNVLTSGGLLNKIVKNSDLLNTANKYDLQILCGGGINSANYQKLISQLDCCDIHIGSLAYNEGDFSKGINKQSIANVKSYQMNENNDY